MPSARSRHPGSEPVCALRETVEATAFRDLAFRWGEVFREPDFLAVEADDLAVAFRVALRPVAPTVFLVGLLVLAERAARREVFDDDVVEDELLTKRTGFFAREAVVEVGFRFFEEAMVRY